MKRKSIFTLLASLLISIVVITGCNEDKLSQEEIIEQQQVIDFVVRVYNGATATQVPVDSVTVTIINHGEKMEVVTEEDGLAIFEDVTIGDNVPVMITKSNYTSVYTDVDLTPYDYRQAVENFSVPIYSFANGSFITIKGRLTAEIDVTNRKAEPVPQGILVKARQNNLSYANQYSFVDSTDAEGYYEIKVPTREGYNYDDVEVVYQEFTADQTIALEDEDNPGVYSVVQRPSIFRYDDNSGYSNEIKSVPSVWATIDDPAYSNLGSGLALTARVKPTALFSFLFGSGINLISRGSGYTDGWQTFTFSADSKGNTATVDILVQNGRLTNSFSNHSNNSAKYTSAPTLNLNDNGGTGGQVEIIYNGRYDIIITSGGSNYHKMPKVSIEAPVMRWSDEMNQYVLKKETDDDINDNLNAIDFLTSNMLSDYASIASGSIVPDYGDTLVTVYLGGMPEFEVFVEESKPAEITIEPSDIDGNDSTLLSITIDDPGSGYDPLNPPSVNLNMLAGYGSGARIKADVNSNGNLEFIEIIEKGDGFVKNVNDFRGTGVTSNSYQSPSYPSNWIYNITAGGIYVRDVFYGTGDPVED